MEDKPVKEEQPSSLGGGGFDFLNTFEEVKSATKKPSSMNDFDFSGFDNMKSSNSQTPKNTFPSSSTPQNTTSSQQNHSLKKLGNPFNNPPMQQKKEDMFQGMNLGGSNSTNNTNFNQPSAQGDGWGNLDNELENLGFSSNNKGGMSQNNNQNNNGGWQDFNVPQNNAPNYGGSSQFNMNQQNSQFSMPTQNNFGYNNNNNQGNQYNQYNQGMNFTPSNQQQQQNKNKENQFGNPTMPKQQKPAKHQFGVADDFFESFDVPKTTQQSKGANNNFNFIKKPNTLNTNDDLI